MSGFGRNVDHIRQTIDPIARRSSSNSMAERIHIKSWNDGGGRLFDDLLRDRTGGGQVPGLIAPFLNEVGIAVRLAGGGDPAPGEKGFLMGSICALYSFIKEPRKLRFARLLLAQLTPFPPGSLRGLFSRLRGGSAVKLTRTSESMKEG
jgi:hypothetical protein